MSNLDRLKKELQPMVDKGLITAKQYQDKIDEAVKQDKNYAYKNNSITKKHILLSLFSGLVGFLIGKRV